MSFDPSSTMKTGHQRNCRSIPAFLIEGPPDRRERSPPFQTHSELCAKPTSTPVPWRRSTGKADQCGAVWITQSRGGDRASAESAPQRLKDTSPAPVGSERQATPRLGEPQKSASRVPAGGGSRRNSRSPASAKKSATSITRRSSLGSVQMQIGLASSVRPAVHSAAQSPFANASVQRKEEPPVLRPFRERRFSGGRLSALTWLI